MPSMCVHSIRTHAVFFHSLVNYIATLDPLPIYMLDIDTLPIYQLYNVSIRCMHWYAYMPSLWYLSTILYVTITD